MKLQLAGYDFAPQEQFQKDMMDYGQSQTAPWAGDSVDLPPQPAQPIYKDDAGNHFAAVPTDDGVAAMPFIPGSPAKQNTAGGIGPMGGFVATDQLPAGGGGGDPLGGMLGGVIQEMPGAAVGDWLGGAAANAALSGAAGQSAAQAMQSLGITNPLVSGPLGAAMQAAVGAAGLGPAAGLLGGLMGGGQAMGGAMGSAALSGLLKNSGLGNIPGAGAAVSMLGGNLGQQMGGLLGGGDLLGSLDDASGAIQNIVAGDLPGINDLPGMGNFDPTALGADALEGAADQLLDQWQVDDESSAAETIANDLVKDNQAQIKEAIKDPNGFMDKIKGIFAGADPGNGMPAVRMGDLDGSADVSTMGVATILFQGQPVSRITDLVAGPKAPAPGLPIAEGSTLVFSAGMPTAFVTCKTTIPTTMATGAGTILVGCAAGDVAPPPTKDAKDTADNSGPAGPKGPASASSGSGDGGGKGAEPAKQEAAKQEETPGETGEQQVAKDKDAMPTQQEEIAPNEGVGSSSKTEARDSSAVENKSDLNTPNGMEAGDSNVINPNGQAQDALIPPCPKNPPGNETNDGWCRDTTSESGGIHGGHPEWRSYGSGPKGGQQCVYTTDESDGQLVTGKYAGSVDKAAPSIGEDAAGNCTRSVGNRVKHTKKDFFPWLVGKDKYNGIQECMRNNGVPSGSMGSVPYQDGISDQQLQHEYDRCMPPSPPPQPMRHPLFPNMIVGGGEMA